VSTGAHKRTVNKEKNSREQTRGGHEDLSVSEKVTELRPEKEPAAEETTKRRDSTDKATRTVDSVLKIQIFRAQDVEAKGLRGGLDVKQGKTVLF